MTISKIGKVLKKEFPNEYSSFTIDINSHAGSPVKAEITLYTAELKHVYGDSFEDCLQKARALKASKTRPANLDQEVPEA